MVGAGGRMGLEVCRAVSEATDLELVAAIDPAHAGGDAYGRTIVGEVNALSDLGAEVVVDFTIAEAVRHNVTHYAAQGIHAVIGTSGLSDGDVADMEALFAAERRQRRPRAQLRHRSGAAPPSLPDRGAPHGRRRDHRAAP